MSEILKQTWTPSRSPLDELVNQDSARADILKGVKFEVGFNPSSLVFNDQLGTFELLHEDGSSQFLMFRVHSDPDAAALTHRTTNEQQKAKKSWYGKGTYLGNTPESVGVYGWKLGTTTSVFLTPPIRSEQIIDQRNQLESHVVTACKLGSHLLRSMRLQKNAVKAVDNIDESYGDARLAVIDMGTDIYLGQKAFSVKHTHSVKPCWFVWRGKQDELIKVGTVEGRELPIRSKILRTVNQAIQKRAISARRGS